MYCSKGFQNTLSFKNFLELLPGLGVHFEPEGVTPSRQDSLKSFMLLLVKVYEAEVAPEIVDKLVENNLSIEPTTKNFLYKLAPELLKLYKVKS
jgi:hypothetical protein